jgi:hypothetical protein
MPFHCQLNYLQNSENRGQISFVTSEIFEEIKVVRFFLDKLYIKMSLSHRNIMNSINLHSNSTGKM